MPGTMNLHPLNRLPPPFPGDDLYLGTVRCLTPSWRRNALRRFVLRQSPFNRERVLSSLYDRYGRGSVDELVGRISSSRFFAVNLSLGALLSVWRDGRIKSFWETGVTGMTLAVEVRDSLERRLGTRGSGETDDPHPIYGAVGFSNGRDEIFGPATGYGECHVRLKEQTVKERAVFLYGDLGDTHLGNHGQRLFDFADVHVARAKAEIDRDATYIEMQVFGGVRVSDIDEVVIPAGRLGDNELKSLQAAHPHVSLKLV